jgi:two-component system, NarL family, sensor kinase
MELWLMYARSRPDLPPRPTMIREDDVPWVFAQVRAGHIVRVAGPESLPDEATADRRRLETLGVRSAVLVPLLADGVAVGCLSVGTVHQERRWPDEWIPRLLLLADAFANALERQRAARGTRESQEAIRDLAGRLMTAQEEERRRIARDLHDDVSQQLAAQSIALSNLSARLPDGTTAAVRQDVARLHARTVDLAKTIRHLSHSLHPGVLQHVGLVAALRGYCRGFEQEHGLPVKFRTDGELSAVPSDAALCLYRVAQEGLGNVARHAKASIARVTIRREGNDVVLTIGDDGHGFDLAEARRQRGLGLISLEERIRLAGGHLTIDSQPEQGTELRITVPLSEARDAPRDRAAG